jgi:hypothetical protein
MHEKEKMPEPFDDAWVTRALQARVNAEPRPGLEERILARLTTGDAQKEISTWKQWAAPAAALGTLVIVLAGYEFFRETPNDETRAAHPAKTLLAPNAGGETHHRNLGPQTILAVRQKAPRSLAFTKSTTVQTTPNSLPKLEHFPADTPPTEQEKHLSELARTRALGSLVQIAQNSAPLRDLEIKSNSIEPLSPETANPGDEPNR